MSEDRYSPGWILAENILDCFDPKRNYESRFKKWTTDRLQALDYGVRIENGIREWTVIASKDSHRVNIRVSQHNLNDMGPWSLADLVVDSVDRGFKRFKP